MVFKGILRGNMKVFVVRDILILTSAGLNGGLTVIYTMTILGADALTIGLLGSFNAVIGTSFQLIGGWMGDRYNRKKMFLLGTGLTMLNPLVYSMAPSWQYLVVVNVTGPIGESIAGPVGFSMRVSSVERSMLTKTTATL